MPREGLEQADIIRLIDRSNATILDIGTNNGDMSDNFSKWFPYGQIFAFEPDPRAIRKMRARNLSPRIHLTEKALGRSVGTATFHQSSGQDLGAGVIDRETGQIEEWDQSGSLRAPKEHLALFPWISFDKRIDVEVTTLDAWCAETRVKDIDFIWADVQGAEEDLILGGMQTLRTTKYFYTEFSDREIYENAIGLQGILDLLPDFQVVEVFERDVLLFNRRAWG
ncbi:FkbM family methyltransferase [Methylobacterium sp. A49B]